MSRWFNKLSSVEQLWKIYALFLSSSFSLSLSLFLRFYRSLLLGQWKQLATDIEKCWQTFDGKKIPLISHSSGIFVCDCVCDVCAKWMVLEKSLTLIVFREAHQRSSIFTSERNIRMETQRRLINAIELFWDIRTSLKVAHVIFHRSTSWSDSLSFRLTFFTSICFQTNRLTVRQM